jgi:ribulose-5-phosphate 4-epimerase/fuculose-1-phosphate aldolase
MLRRGAARPVPFLLLQETLAVNIHTKTATEASQAFSPDEWRARVDLAACYRLAAQHGWDDVIFNHCSMRVPGEDRKFLMKRHELLWTEVTASNLVKVDMDADLDESAGVNRPGFTLHGGVLRGRPDINSAVHVHTRIGMAIAGLKGGLRMVSQEATRFYGCVGYHTYEGITEDFGERERLLAHLGNNRALILQNHGLLTVGRSPAEAFGLMKRLIEAAEVQLLMQSAGQEVIDIPPDICAKTSAQLEKHDSGRGSAEWPAYLRMLDRIDPSYRT